MSHLQNCSLKIYLKRALGVGGRVEGGGGVRIDVNEELNFLLNLKKNFFLGGGGGGGSGWM